MSPGSVPLLLGMVLVLAGPGAHADEPVVTILADYETDSVAAHITDVENVQPADCDVAVQRIPAREQRSLMLEVGATTPQASAACDLHFRLDTRFDQAERVATYAWITRGSIELQFRVRDAAGRIFETRSIRLQTHNRWERLAASLVAKNLKLVGPRLPPERMAGVKPTWPIQILGYRVRTQRIGRQTVYLDDLQVEHRVAGTAVLRGEFELDEPTHLYEPGALVRAAVVLENTSRQRALPLSVQLAWLRSDGSELTTGQQSINLPASSDNYRSRQAVHFNQRIAEPGLYQLLARVRGPGWLSPATFETTIAVTRTNRTLPRGRETFFGVRTNLLREPWADQLLEIDVAREIGVQLLVIDTPWAMIEPSRNVFDFAPLDALINHVTRRNIAAMITLTEPPEWLSDSSSDRWDRQATLFEALAREYAGRIYAYQPLPADANKPGRLSAADLTAVQELQRRVTQVQPNAKVRAPPVAVPPQDAKTPAPLTLPSNAQVPLMFETAGDSAAAVAALRAFSQQHDLQWQRSHYWSHRAEALDGSGALCDAVAVLHHYIAAAADGAGGVVWFDLRDDTGDARHPEQMQGLVRRDFSPKTPLLGFANGVGMLHGLLYAGEVSGTPAEFESALFIGGARQVAVLFPKPNRILPAALAPYQLVPGDLAVFDFERRESPLARSTATPLLPMISGPLFITLDCQRAQTDPKLGLARPWLRVPEIICCGDEATVRIEIDAPADLRRSYLQLSLPFDAPVESSLSARALRGKAGDTLAFDVVLTRTGAQIFRPTTLTVRVSLEGQSVHVPVTVRPLAEVAALKANETITAENFAVGTLTPPRMQQQAQQMQVAAALHVAYQSDALHIGVSLPSDAPADAVLQLGIAAEGAEKHAEIRIDGLTERPLINPIYGLDQSQLRTWHCRKISDRKGEKPFCHITIPARALGRSSLKQGMRLLLAARYEEPPRTSWTPPLVLEWGAGLDGRRCTRDYHWVRLAQGSEN